MSDLFGKADQMKRIGRGKRKLVLRFIKMIEHVSVEELKTILDSKTGCHLIDVREFSEYEAVRIPNSALISLSVFDQKVDLIDKNSPNYFLCGVGKRALKAAEYLLSLGYKNLYVIDGGIKAWIEAGYPVECG